MEEIKKQLLGICVNHFNAFAAYSGDEVGGRPPRVYYIDFFYEDGRGEKYSGDVREQPETYRYENGTLEQVETGTKNEIDPYSGVFFKEGHATISIDRINNYAYFSFAVGSLFGRGFRFEIWDGLDGKTLGPMKMLWIS